MTTVADRGMSALQQRHPAQRATTLDRSRLLSQLMGEPQRAFPSIHVTGTNGKTTITRMVAAVLTAHGQTTGAYTSPHLQDVSERIRVDGVPADRRQLESRLAVIDSHRDTIIEHCGEPPAFFETMTALACDHFARQGVDAAVFEVGIGGRRDATNILDAPVAVLGEVRLDHPELGGTIGDIAAHKAGIIKPGGIAVIGPQPGEAAAIIDSVVAARQAGAWRFGTDILLRDHRLGQGGQSFTVCLPTGEQIAVELSLAGSRHAVNAALALATARAHLGAIDPVVAAGALAVFRAPGRGEIVPRADSGYFWLDGAHNPAAITSLVDTLCEVPGMPGAIAVVAVMADKDVTGIAAALARVTRRAMAVPVSSDRGADPIEVAGALRCHGVKCDLAADLTEGIARAEALAASYEPVVVTGSLYLVGAARTVLGLAVE